MAIAIHSFMIDTDNRVRIAHTFFGETEEAAKAKQKAHADHCPAYGPAVRAGKVIDIVEEIDGLPEADEEELTALLGLDDFDDDDED